MPTKLYNQDNAVHLYHVCSFLSHQQIEEYKDLNYYDADPLSPAASSHYARGLFSMPNLRSVDLINVKLSDEYYATMATEASESKVCHHLYWKRLSLITLSSLSLSLFFLLVLVNAFLLFPYFHHLSTILFAISFFVLCFQHNPRVCIVSEKKMN